MILVFIPYHPSKKYVLSHLFDWIAKAELPDCDVVIRADRGIYNENLAIKKQREWARQLAVDKDCSHLLFIDADTIPPYDVLPKLLDHKWDVVSALYHGRLQENPNEVSTVAWKQSDPLKQFLYHDGLVEVDGVGMGCVLLSRKAFTSFTFFDWADPSDDFPAFDLLREKGFPCMLDTRLVCRHYATSDNYA